jgi:hypothetical protein
LETVVVRPEKIASQRRLFSFCGLQIRTLKYNVSWEHGIDGYYGILTPELLRQQLRIPYTNWPGRERTYVADFLVEESQLIEIKLQKLQSSKDVISKTKSAKKFCKKKRLDIQSGRPTCIITC